MENAAHRFLTSHLDIDGDAVVNGGGLKAARDTADYVILLRPIFSLECQTPIKDRHMNPMFKLFVMAAAVLLSTPAMAYIGPGAGISVLGSLLGILATIVVAIGAIVMWPLRKALKKRRQASSGTEESTPDSGPEINEAENTGATPGDRS